MKTSITEIIRRGFVSVLANWPLLLIRIAEGVVFMIIVVVAVIAAVIPVIISLGVQQFDPRSPAEAAELIVSIFTERWPILLYLFGLATAVLIVFVMIHSFVEAGSARVYVDAERAVRGIALPQRPQLQIFSVNRWLDGGKRQWWPVFWIYNLAWGMAGLLILVPMLAVLLIMFIVRERQGALIAVGCLGLAVSLLFAVVVSIITNIWCRKAIVVTAVARRGPAESLSEAWREFRLDAGRHIGVALILFLVTIVGSGVISSFSMAFNWGGNSSAAYNLAIMPLQLVGSLIHTVFSAVMSSWFLASFATLTVEK